LQLNYHVKHDEEEKEKKLNPDHTLMMVRHAPRFSSLAFPHDSGTRLFEGFVGAGRGFGGRSNMMHAWQNQPEPLEIARRPGGTEGRYGFRRPNLPSQFVRP
jgi:hypothetical protein